MWQRAAPSHDTGSDRRPAAARGTCSGRSRLTSTDIVAVAGLAGRAGSWNCRSGTVSLKVHHYFLLSQMGRLRPGFFYREEARLAWGA